MVIKNFGYDDDLFDDNNQEILKKARTKLLKSAY